MSKTKHSDSVAISQVPYYSAYRDFYFGVPMSLFYAKECCKELNHRSKDYIYEPVFSCYDPLDETMTTKLYEIERYLADD